MADKGKSKVAAAAAAASSRPAGVPGGKVISYFTDTDGQSGNPLIGYDVERFNAAVQQVVVPEVKPQREEDAEAARARAPKAGHAVNGDDGGEAAKVDVKKEDIELVASQFDVPNKEAESALRRAGGDVVKALRSLTLPAHPQTHIA